MFHLNLWYLFQCAESLKYDYKPIESCKNGNDGEEFLAYYGDKTNKLEPALVSVPTIVFNDVSKMLILAEYYYN